MTLIVLADRAEDEQEWLAERRKVVTASDLVHLMDAADKLWRKTPEQLLSEKRSGGSFSSQLANAGSFWEPHILSYLDEMVGLESYPETRLLQNPSTPFLSCSPDAWLGDGPAWAITRSRKALDGFLHLYRGSDTWYGEEAVERLLEALAKAKETEVESDWLSPSPESTLWFPGLVGKCLVEVKNQASKQRPKWNKPGGAPKYYVTQCQAQMAVVPVDFVLLVARVDANEIHAHIIDRDDFYIELVHEVARDFYERMKGGT